MPLSASLSVPWAPSWWARWCQELVSVLLLVGCLPLGLGCGWLVRTSEGLVLKTSGAELPCLGLNLGLERILFAEVL